MTSRSSGSNKGSGTRNKQHKPQANTSSSHSAMNGRKGNTAQARKKGSPSSVRSQHNSRTSGDESKREYGASYRDSSNRHRASDRKQSARRRNDDSSTVARSANETASSHREHSMHSDHADVSEHVLSKATARSVSIPVLYEDNHVIGVVKPVNIPSQADDTGDEDMLTLIKQDLKERHQKAGNVFLGLVHRLDRPVGGAMLFAKTSKGASRLSDSVRNGRLLKRYIAVLRGIPARPKATLRDTLLKDTRTNTSAVVASGTTGGKDAVLDYEVLATHTQANLSLVLITLHTGRSHQIRVQMSHAGYPLYGDQRYGVTVNRPGEQLALWSVLAGAPHPVKDEQIRILSLPPRVRPWNQWSEHVYDQLTERLEREQD